MQYKVDSKLRVLMLTQLKANEYSRYFERIFEYSNIRFSPRLNPQI